MRVSIAVAALALILSACGPSEKAEAPPPAAQTQTAAKAPPAAAPAAVEDAPLFIGDPCRAELYQDLIGRTEDFVRNSASLPSGARVICNGCMRTMDNIPDRLNVEIGVDGNVAALSCG